MVLGVVRLTVMNNVTYNVADAKTTKECRTSFRTYMKSLNKQQGATP